MFSISARTAISDFWSLKRDRVIPRPTVNGLGTL